MELIIRKMKGSRARSKNNGRKWRKKATGVKIVGRAAMIIVVVGVKGGTNPMILILPLLRVLIFPRARGAASKGSN